MYKVFIRDIFTDNLTRSCKIHLQYMYITLQFYSLTIQNYHLPQSLF